MRLNGMRLNGMCLKGMSVKAASGSHARSGDAPATSSASAQALRQKSLCHSGHQPSLVCAEVVVVVAFSIPHL